MRSRQGSKQFWGIEKRARDGDGRGTVGELYREELEKRGAIRGAGKVWERLVRELERI